MVFKRWSKEEVIKLSKTLLLLSVAIYFTIVVFNNLIDYGTNFEFVKHVLSMDTTFKDNNLMWRSITSSTAHHIFYWIIILWELGVAILAWIGTVNCFKIFNKKKFEKGEKQGIIGIVLGLLLWFLAFMTVGGEWFAMWQSEIWNGQDAAFRMFAIMGIILLLFSKKNKKEEQKNDK